MPSLRDSGKLVGPSASLRQVAQQCGLSYPLSLREFISTHGCPFSRCNRLHIKVLYPPAISIEIMLNRMREVYGTARIGVEVVSRENLTTDVLGHNTYTVLNDLDAGDCDTPTTEQEELFQNRNYVSEREIVVYFVRGVFVDGLGRAGCAAHPEGKPGAALAQSASEWTLAHEVGHVLGLEHLMNEPCFSPPTRLMTSCGTDNIVDNAIIVQYEIDIMRSSNLTRQC